MPEDFLPGLLETLELRMIKPGKANPLTGLLTSPETLGAGSQIGYTDEQGQFQVTNPEARKVFFDRFFEGSKVVDEEGNPLVVYHGGKFDSEQGDKVFEGSNKTPFTFFTPDKNLAETYGPKITEAFVSVKNPFMPTNQKDVRSPWVKDWIDFWREEEGWFDRSTGEEMSDEDVYEMIENTSLYNYEPEGSGERWHDFLGTASEHHDGFIGYDPTDGAEIVVPFNNTQIKSAEGNRGTFDPQNPDIYSMNVMNKGLLAA